MIMTRITQFFYLAAVHEQGSAQRNPFTLKLPSLDKVYCWGPELSSAAAGVVPTDGSEPELQSGIWAFLAARSGVEPPWGCSPWASGGETPSPAATAPAALAAKHPGAYIASGSFFLPSLNISQNRGLGKKLN